MTPQEWWWEYDMRVTDAQKVQEALGKHNQAGPDWDKLRELHKAKMNGSASTN